MKSNLLSQISRIIFFSVIALMVSVFMISCEKKSSTQKAREDAATIDSDKCAHNALKSLCFTCDASLRDPKRLWCKEHNNYEDRCFQCHPEAQDKSRLYCKEHSLYEDECFLCHPELKYSATESQQEPNTSSASVQCKEHGVPEVECGICHPELLSQKKPGEGLKIRFESVNSAEKAGVDVAHPETTLVDGGYSFPARTSFNENEATTISSRFSGTLTSVKVDLGVNVKKGQIVATISSPEYAEIVAEFRSAEQEARVKEAEYLREKELFEGNATSRQDKDNAALVYKRAQNAVDAIHQKLANAGLSNEQINIMLEDHSLNSEFPVRSPISGTVTQKMVSVGQTVNPDSPIVFVVNLSTLWVFVTVPSAIGLKLQVGDVLQVSFDQGITDIAKVNWISPAIDMSSGMIQIRAELSNRKNNIKSGMFGKAIIAHSSQTKVLVVPSDAIANIDGNNIIFTKEAPDVYAAKKVVLNGVLENRAFIAEGLTIQDQVVVNGTFVVKSEFLKSRLGAGCVDD